MFKAFAFEGKCVKTHTRTKTNTWVYFHTNDYPPSECMLLSESSMFIHKHASSFWQVPPWIWSPIGYCRMKDLPLIYECGQILLSFTPGLRFDIFFWWIGRSSVIEMLNQRRKSLSMDNQSITVPIIGVFEALAHSIDIVYCSLLELLVLLAE